MKAWRPSENCPGVAVRTAVIIPALNEAGAIGRVVEEVPVDWVDEVIVVDNGSSDSTAEVAAAAGARVISQLHRGYGYACAAGAAAAVDAELLVFLDGDYSFRPAEIPRLLTPLREGQADLVLGSRLAGGSLPPGAMPHHARFGNWLVSRLMRVLYGLQVTDLGPFRAIRRSLLIDMAMQEMTYGWPTEMMVKAARSGLRVREVPVSYHPRLAGRSKVSGTFRGSVLATLGILRVTFRYIFPRSAST